MEYLLFFVDENRCKNGLTLKNYLEIAEKSYFIYIISWGQAATVRWEQSPPRWRLGPGPQRQDKVTSAAAKVAAPSSHKTQSVITAGGEPN